MKREGMSPEEFATLRAGESVRSGDPYAEADLEAAERLARKVLRG